MERWSKLQADCSDFLDVWYLPLDDPQFRKSYDAALLHHDLLTDSFTLNIRVSARCMGGNLCGIPIPSATLSDAKKQSESWCRIGYYTVRRMLLEQQQKRMEELEAIFE